MIITWLSIAITWLKNVLTRANRPFLLHVTCWFLLHSLSLYSMHNFFLYARKNFKNLFSLQIGSNMVRSSSDLDLASKNPSLLVSYRLKTAIFINTTCILLRVTVSFWYYGLRLCSTSFILVIRKSCWFASLIGCFRSFACCTFKIVQVKWYLIEFSFSGTRWYTATVWTSQWFLNTKR